MTFSILDAISKRITVEVDMHELSLTRNILGTALKNAGEKRILRVNLLMGPLSDEREESIRFYWNDLAKGTLARDAELYFQRVPREMKCLECGTIFQFEEQTSMCPHCYSHRLRLMTGADVRLDSIDVE